MTISIGGAIDFEFPNELLVVPPTNVEKDGAVRANDSVREVMLGPTSAALGNGPAILGRHFFQAAYLMVDYESNSFTLWNANTTSSESNLVALDNCTVSKDTSLTSDDSSTANSAPSQGSNASEDSGVTENETPKSGLSTGAVAGIAVGGTCAVLGAAVAAIVVFCLRRRKRTKPYAGSQSSSIGLAQHQQDSFRGIPMRHEAMSGQVNELNAYSRPSELSSDWKAKHELDAQYFWRNTRLPTRHHLAELGSP